MRIVTWDEVRARRLARGHLAERAPADRLVEVVRDACGIHAQVASSAELSLAARVEGITQEDVREALWQRRDLVKAATLRGTLHLHPADELSLWASAQRAYPSDGSGWWYEEQGLSADQRLALESTVREVVGAEPLTRAEIADAVVERLGDWAREPMSTSWNFVLGGEGQCYGPNRGRNVTFVRADRWLGPQRDLEPAAALAEVVRRYLGTYGPATHREFRQWFGGRSFRPPEAQALFESLGPELVEVELDGRPASLPAADRDVSRELVPGHVRLLPEYDAYVMGFRERDELVPEAVRAQVAAHGKGRYEGPAGTPFLLVDGLAAGIWSRARRGRRVELTVEPARKLSRAVRAGIDAEAARIGEFLGAVPELRVV